MINLHLRRLGAVIAAAVTAAAVTLTLLPGTSQASTVHDGRTPQRSALWLTRQLSGHLVHNDQYDFDDYGLTADLGLAVAAIEGRTKDVRGIRKALSKHVASWTTGVDVGSSDVYAGSTAKALVFAETTGAHPRSFGGVDLVAQLDGLVTASGPAAGRVADRSTSGDFANTIGQAFAAQGLANAKDSLARPVLAFLLGQQCGKGFFRLDFNAATDPVQTCDGSPKSAQQPDTDATAFAVLSLLSLPHRTHKATKALAAALHWLHRQQSADGSFGGGVSTSASNSNSTGLAGYALAQAGDCKDAGQAARWVQRLEVPIGVASLGFAGETGAIAYDKAAFRQAKLNGIGSADRDQWRRATAQAAPVLLYLGGQGCPS